MDEAQHGDAPLGQDTTDFATLQTSFTLLLAQGAAAATIRKWDGFLQQGLAAAKAGDKAGVKASCKGCHDAHKEDVQEGPERPEDRSPEGASRREAEALRAARKDGGGVW